MSVRNASARKNARIAKNQHEEALKKKTAGASSLDPLILLKTIGG